MNDVEAVDCLNTMVEELGYREYDAETLNCLNSGLLDQPVSKEKRCYFFA